MRAAGIGTFPCEFRLVVHEATQIPKGCQTLSVAWKKGVKEVSTGPAPVVDGRADWDCTIPISSILSRRAAGNGEFQFEAKLCFLEVKGEGGDVIGNTQLDLAEFCDGHVHERDLSMVSRGGVGTNACLLRLRVSVVAHVPGLIGSVPPLEPPSLLEPAADYYAEGSPTLSNASPRRGIARSVSQLSEADANYVDIAQLALLAAAASSAPQTGPSPRQMRLRPHVSGLPKRLSSSRIGGSPTASSCATVPEPTSKFSTVLTKLPARLVALCKRQCLTSGLSSVQQEDALRLFVSALRSAREPLSSCGIVFSTVPLHAVVPTLQHRSATQESTTVVGSTISATPSHPAAACPGSGISRAEGVETSDLSSCGGAGLARLKVPSAQPGLPAAPASAHTTSAWTGTTRPVKNLEMLPAAEVDQQSVPPWPPAMGAGAATVAAVAAACGSIPAGVTSSTISVATTAAEASSRVCTGHLCEMLSHLSDIRSLALALTDDEPTSPCGAPDDGVNMSPTRIGAALTSAANVFAVGVRSLAGRAGRVDQVPGAGAAAGEPAPEPQVVTPAPMRKVQSFGSLASSDTVPHECSISPGSRSRSSSVAGRRKSSITQQHASLPFRVVMSQIIHGVDEVASIGGQVLKDVGTEFGSLVMHLHELSRERDLWAHRFLACRELQYSGALCAQAMSIDQTNFAVASA